MAEVHEDCGTYVRLSVGDICYLAMREIGGDRWNLVRITEIQYDRMTWITVVDPDLRPTWTHLSECREHVVAQVTLRDDIAQINAQLVATMLDPAHAPATARALADQLTVLQNRLD